MKPNKESVEIVMSFLSFHLGYYQKEIEKLKVSPGETADLLHAKRLLKILEDLNDEGYHQLSQAVEASFAGVSALREYLRRYGERPFSSPPKPSLPKQVIYDSRETELTEAIGQIVKKAEHGTPSEKPFLAELDRFARWVGYEEDTAYVFLLRDTFLPYVAYLSAGRERIHPLLLGRAALAALAGETGVDDVLRATVTDALEADTCNDFAAFCEEVLPAMREILQKYPRVRETLETFLREIPQRRIITVESGCTGTFPLLLMSLDQRVEMRMYTAYPYLAELYGERLYTRRYEDVRAFETLVSQDVYFRFSSLRDGKTFVQACKDPAVEREALGEIRTLLTI